MKIFYFFVKKENINSLENYFHIVRHTWIGEFENEIFDESSNILKNITKYELPKNCVNYDVFSSEIHRRFSRLYHESHDLLYSIKDVNNEFVKVKFWNPINFKKFLSKRDEILYIVFKLNSEFENIKKSLVMKPIKRVYSELDPYGEENWDE